MELLLISIFFLLFIQLVIGVIIVCISASNKDLYYEYNEIKKELYISPFEFQPIYKNRISKKLIEDSIEGYKLSIELKYIMAMFGIAMSIEYLLNLF